MIESCYICFEKENLTPKILKWELFDGEKVKIKIFECEKCTDQSLGWD